MNTHTLVTCVVFIAIVAAFPAVHVITKDFQAQYEQKSSVSKREEMRSRGYSRRDAHTSRKGREEARQEE
jgi:5-bromo-4-chloroindolyl phosphate hydrolysis protein